MNKMIIWSKYAGIRAEGRNQIEYIPEKEVKSDKFDNDPYERYDFDEDDQETDHSEPQQIVITDFGVIPLRPYNDLAAHFNLWVGETDFNLSDERIEIIDKTRGVEALNIYSRYRFRIAVGSCFSFQEVRQNIEKALGVTPKKSEVLPES